MPRAVIGGQVDISTRDAQAALRNFEQQARAHARGLGNIPAPGEGGRGFFGGRTWTELNSKLEVVGKGVRTIAKLGGSLLQSDTNFEGLIRALSAASDGTETLDFQVKELAKTGSLPGLSFEIATRGAIKLQSLGYTAKDAREYIAELGNEVARTGGTVENMDGFLTQMAQTLSKNKVEMDDFKIMSEHVTGFMKTAQGLDRDNAKGFFAGLLGRLKEMPRVIAGTQESLKNIKDQWEVYKATESKGRVAGVASAVADFGQRTMKGGLSIESMGAAWQEVKGAAMGENTDPMKKYAQGEEEIQKRKEVEAARAKQERDRIENTARLELQKLNDIEDLEEKIRDAKEAGNKEEQAAAEDNLAILQHAEELAKKLSISHERAAQFIRDQNHHAREIAEREEKRARAKTMEEERSRQAIEGARANGRTKTANRLEKEHTLKTETDRYRKMGLTPEEARSMAETDQRNREDAEHYSRTGRRKIRGRGNDVRGDGGMSSKNNRVRSDGGMKGSLSGWHSDPTNFAKFFDEGIPGFAKNYGAGSNRKQQAAAQAARDKAAGPSVVETAITAVKEIAAKLERISAQLLKNGAKPGA